MHATPTASTARRLPDRWVLGIVAGFAVMVTVNLLFLYAALDNPVTIEASYTEEAR